jgi:hypothetical protein
MKIRMGLVVEALPEGGCLVVDESSKQSHALGAEATAVWRCLEGGVDEVVAIAASTGLAGDVVEAALGQLAAAGLIEVESGSSRREWLARAATVAGAAAGLKLIETIATPTPAAAQSLQPDGDSQQDGA